MELSKVGIAELFSNGKFEDVFDFLSDGIIWDVVGENRFSGKKEVISQSTQTARYFESVQTYFNTSDVIDAGHKIIIRGTAEFKRDGKRVNFITACDVYYFNDTNKIEKIFSYCIPEKNEN